MLSQGSAHSLSKSLLNPTSIKCDKSQQYICEEDKENEGTSHKPKVETTNPQHWLVSERLYSANLIKTEREYMPDPYYIEEIQPNLSSTMRSILCDWMIEVCSELTLKRETLHLAINYTDRYLSICSCIPKKNYQLIGLTCMFIAAKVEEVLPPVVHDWAVSADNGYTINDIIDTEKTILKAMSFKIYPATCFHWVNWLMSQWDSYIDFHYSCVFGNNLNDFDNFADKRILKDQYDRRMILFKQANQKAYKRYRESMQVLDLSVMLVESLKFPPKYLAAGLMYLMINKYFYESRFELLYYTGDFKNEDFDIHEEIDRTAIVQDLFSIFIETAADITDLQEIYPAVTFIHPLLDMDFRYDLPVICSKVSREKLESHYEDFLSFQTHNPSTLEFSLNPSNPPI